MKKILLVAALAAMAMAVQARPLFDTMSFTATSISNDKVNTMDNDTLTVKTSRLFDKDSKFSSSVIVNRNQLTKGKTVTTNVSVVWNFK